MEAQYFLKRLAETKDDPRLYYYYLSAFLTAWRSVLDVMLYDFIEYYPLRLDRKVFVNSNIFWVAANALNHTNALDFISWWNKKAEAVRGNELSKMRITTVHKGFPRTVYAPATLSSGSFVVFSSLSALTGLDAFGYPTVTVKRPLDSSDDTGEIPEIIKKCEEGYKLIESMVVEAEKRFRVTL